MYVHSYSSVAVFLEWRPFDSWSIWPLYVAITFVKYLVINEEFKPGEVVK